MQKERATVQVNLMIKDLWLSLIFGDKSIVYLSREINNVFLHQIRCSTEELSDHYLAENNS